MPISASFDFQVTEEAAMYPAVVMRALSKMVTQQLPSHQSPIAFKKTISLCNRLIITMTFWYSSGSKHYTCFTIA